VRGDLDTLMANLTRPERERLTAAGSARGSRASRGSIPDVTEFRGFVVRECSG
jgi:hypothetical protein